MRPPPKPTVFARLARWQKQAWKHLLLQTKPKEELSKDNDSYHNLYETTITAQGRIQLFFKEGVVILRIQGKRSKAKGTGEGKGWEWGRARVMFEYIWQPQSWNIYYKLLVIGQVKSDSFGVRFKHFVIDTIITRNTYLAITVAKLGFVTALKLSPVRRG